MTLPTVLKRHFSLRKGAVLLSAPTWLSGCERSPAFNVLGSYFPGWLACMLLGVLGAAMVQMLLGRLGWQRSIPASPIFYFALAVLFASTLWLITFE